MNYWRAAEQTRGFHPSLGTDISNGVESSPSSWRDSLSGPWHSNSPSDDIHFPRHLRPAQDNGAPLDLSNREYRSTTFARIAARRQSTMSRLGSRILPNSVIRGLLSSEEETPAEGFAHRHGVVSRSIPRSESVHGSNRFSPFGSLGSRGISRRRSTRGAYFLPRGEQPLVQDTPNPPHSDDHVLEPNRGSRRRSARLHRVRNSLSNPISHMFAPSSTNVQNQDARDSEYRPPQPESDVNYNFRFPPPRTMDVPIGLDEPHELDSVEPTVRNTRPLTPIPPQSNGDQFPGFLRARSSRVLRREEQTPLSRVLQLAAAAIAAQLSGNTGPVVPNIQALGNDGLGGSFENFIQTLQQSASAQANNTSNTTPNAAAETPAGGNGPPSPANFLRVFRFANADSPNESGNPGAGVDGMDVDGSGEGPEGRTVTLVVVGVRSVPSNNDSGDQPPNTGPGLDALLRIPFLSPGNAQRNRGNGPSLPPRPDGRPRFTPGRTAGAPSANSDVNEAGALNTSRRTSDAGTRSTVSSLPTVLSESPPGPNPPPSTPAEPGLSAVSSGASTPSRRPSSASAMPANPLPHLHEYQSMQPTVESTEDVPVNTARQRRRSDSEFARHRDLGSGSVRRNGVVEPDDATPPAGRSWLIYVVGTNLSENHPAFATPSLFTDVSIPHHLNYRKLTCLEPDL